MPNPIESNLEYGPWNPGLQSTLPGKYLALSTMFRTENVLTSIKTAQELHDFTGLPIQQLIRFRPERLIVHELLIRVSADIFVSDGSRYEDLGVNYRTIVDNILRHYIEPHKSEILNSFDLLSGEIEAQISTQLCELVEPPKDNTTLERDSFFKRIFAIRRKSATIPAPELANDRQQKIFAKWRQQLRSSTDPRTQVIYSALLKITNAIIVKHGRLIGDQSLLIQLACVLVCNDWGSRHIGALITPYIEQAAKDNNYTILPAQKQPVIINIKGASASGKSTMRPLQQKQTDGFGLNWHDFALISPDIWRKYLLDYETLADAYKYAGTLAGDEVPIIDHKLDLYIGKKAQEGRVSHLLVDRFRFDSFAPGKDTKEGSNLLTRFGHTIFLTFMVTPPEQTVERAWKRGLQVGRYKAVDDLLDHNVEAFKGIPVIFFTWALNREKTVHFEFLDNSVAYGEKPLTIAFGSNNEMYLYDFKCMIDITRNVKLNIDATCPEEIFSDYVDTSPQSNTDFLISCAKKLEKIHFVDRQSEHIYAYMECGKLLWMDHGKIDTLIIDNHVHAGLYAMDKRIFDHPRQIQHCDSRTIPEHVLQHTLQATG